MKEAVIFSDPQDVTILATRKGELTQIPGSEFRAPVDVFGVHILADLKIIDNVGSLLIVTDEEISVKVHGLYQLTTHSYDADRIEPYCKPDPMKSYTEWHDPGYGGNKETRYLTQWMRHPGANSKVTYPQQDVIIKILIEITGYYAMEQVVMVNGVGKKFTLPESHGTMAWLVMENPNWSDGVWGY